MDDKVEVLIFISLAIGVFILALGLIGFYEWMTY